MYCSASAAISIHQTSRCTTFGQQAGPSINDPSEMSRIGARLKALTQNSRKSGSRGHRARSDLRQPQIDARLLQERDCLLGKADEFAMSKGLGDEIAGRNISVRSLF